MSPEKQAQVPLDRPDDVVTGSLSESSRAEVLRPFIDQLVALGEHAEAADRPSNVGIGSRTLSVPPWERGVVLEALSESEVGGKGWRALLTESVALWAKTLWDMDRLRGAGGANPNSAFNDLRDDAAIGHALTTELQREVDRLLISGDMDDARRLTQHRNRFSQMVRGIRDVIGEEAVEEAKQRALELIAEAEKVRGEDAGSARELAERRAAGDEDGVDDSADPGDLEALLTLEGELRKQRAIIHEFLEENDLEEAEEPWTPVREAAPPERGSKVKVLSFVLAGLIVVWFGLVALPWLNHVEPFVLEPAHFGDMRIVREVAARPPSLYIKVDPKSWHEMTREERLEVVRTIGDRAERAGYSGVHITFITGGAVASWLKAKGGRLYELPGPDS